MHTHRPIDVVIVEDHIAFRDVLEYFLSQNHGMRCRSFGAVEEALQAIRGHEPDVVVMDIHLPGDDGIMGTRLIKQQWPRVHVLICTVHEDDEKIFNALRAGATGYLLKRAPLDQLVEGIHQALEGGSPISPAIARRVVNSFQEPQATGVDQLTPREREVLDLLSNGMRVKAIADRLFVSESTVRTHVHHIYEKLQVQGRVEMMSRMRGK
jgi:DNA-binding NarL/FixJ family response regulator